MTIKKRLKWSDTKLLCSILVFLDTRCWPSTTPDDESAETEAVDDKDELRLAMEYIVTVFREPLEAKQTCIFAFQDELEEIVDFYRKYLVTQGEEYRRVWYKLHTASDATKGQIFS